MCTFYIQSPKPLQTKNPIFFSTKNLYYCRKQFRKVTEFGKFKTKFTKMPLPKFAKKSSFLESRLNNTELKTTKTKKPSHKKNTLPFIRIQINSINPNIYSTIKSSVTCMLLSCHVRVSE